MINKNTDGNYYLNQRDFYKTQINQTNNQQLADFYQQSFLPEFVCHHTDRAFMLNSIEVRSPFLNPDIIKFANSIPDEYKFNGKYLKFILREHAKIIGFNKNIFMQKKQGFTFPIARWFKSSLKRSLIKMKKSNDWHEGINHKKIEELIDEHLSGNKNYRILFNLLYMEKQISYAKYN